VLASQQGSAGAFVGRRLLHSAECGMDTTPAAVPAVAGMQANSHHAAAMQANSRTSTSTWTRTVAAAAAMQRESRCMFSNAVRS
jgi:hypothetical protein